MQLFSVMTKRATVMTNAPHIWFVTACQCAPRIKFKIYHHYGPDYGHGVVTHVSVSIKDSAWREDLRAQLGEEDQVKTLEQTK
jgi:hypothetical protein